MDEVVLVVLSILAVLILIKLNNLKRAMRRLPDIEDRLIELKSELRKLTQTTPLPAPGAAKVPRAEPEAVTRREAAAPAASTASVPLSRLMESLSAPPPLPPSAPPLPRPLEGRQAATPSVEVPPRAPSKLAQTAGDILNRIWQWILVGEEYRPKGVSMEYAVGTTWLMRVGIVALVAGVGYFLKWSMDHGLLGPTARVAMSVTFGLGMLTGGMCLLGRRWNVLGQGFVGGGLATLYFSMYALGPLYHLVDSQPVVFGLMILVTVAAGVLALSANSMLVAIFGIIGGFCTPLLLHTNEPRFLALYSYLLLLNLGVLGIGHLRQWRLLNYLSFLFTYTIYFLASPACYTPGDFPVALTFLALVFVAHSTLVLLYNLRRDAPATLLEIVHLVLNAAVFSFAAYDVIRDTAGRPYPALMTLAVAVYYCLHVAVFLRRRLADRPLLIALISLAGFYTTLTMPLLMEKESLTIAWALQAFMFLWLGRRLQSAFLRQVSYAVYGLTLFRLAVFEFPRIDLNAAGATTLTAYGSALLNRLWTFGTAIGSIAAAFFLELRQTMGAPASSEAPLPDTADVAPASLTHRLFFWAAVALFFLYLHSECHALFGYALAWRPAVLTTLWCGMALGFLLLYRAAPTVAFRAGLVFFAVGAVAKTLFWDIPGWHLNERWFFDMTYTPFLALMRWFDFLAVLLLLTGIAALLPRKEDRSFLPAAFGYTTISLLWLYLTLELNSLLHWKLHEFQSGGISVLWTLFALALLAGGIWRNLRPLRLSGLVLFTVVVAKVLFVDLADMPTAYRVLALMVIGVLLLLGSFAYLRASKRFTKGESE
jgi:uncharacterized membrane protein